MDFHPDILVTSSDGTDIFLVVETKLDLAAALTMEAELKQFMYGMQCPAGMIVTPERLWIYRDRYTAQRADSIERIGAFRCSVGREGRQEAFAFSEVAFANAVQSWLEGLATEAGRHALPSELQVAVKEHVLPYLSLGLVRAGGPRPLVA